MLHSNIRRALALVILFAGLNISETQPPHWETTENQPPHWESTTSNHPPHWWEVTPNQPPHWWETFES